MCLWSLPTREEVYLLSGHVPGAGSGGAGVHRYLTCGGAPAAAAGAAAAAEGATGAATGAVAAGAAAAGTGGRGGGRGRE
jgi:hypothetical protein